MHTGFRYVSFIFGATPQRVFQALTQRADYDAFLDTTGPQSTWQVGDTVYWKSTPEDDFEDLGQRVVEATPGKALVYTWHGVQSEHRELFDSDADFDAALPERSTVRFYMSTPADLPDAVRLELIHDGFDSPYSVMLNAVAEGWPLIMSALKTHLENQR